MTRKRILFLLTSTRFGGAAGHETLDAAMIAAAFEQHVSILLTGEAVWQLLDAQIGAAVDAKALAPGLAALPMYEINDVYADAETVQRLNLPTDAFCVPVTLLSAPEQADLIRAQDVVFSGQ